MLPGWLSPGEELQDMPVLLVLRDKEKQVLAGAAAEHGQVHGLRAGTLSREEFKMTNDRNL
jgi:hypothetical protein